MSAGPVPPPELLACAAVRSAIGWDRVAVVVATDPDNRLPLRGSDAVLEHYCNLQQSLVQGPGLDVLVSGETVVVDDLRTVTTPWPLLASSTPADSPLRSLAVLPLRVSEVAAPPPEHRQAVDDAGGDQVSPGGGQVAAAGVLGVLAVGRDEPQPFTHRQVGHLTALASLVTAVVLQRAATEQLFAEDAAPNEELPIVVGMLRARLGAGAEEALARLRAYAFCAGTTIQLVARDVLDGHVDLSDVASR